MSASRFSPKFSSCSNTTQPFDNTEQAWFWFMLSNDSRQEGARPISGESLIPRPCEPIDVLKIVDRLYRQRRLIGEHLRIMAHYGRRLMPPDPYRHREVRASALWQEAMAMIEPPLRDKGIIQ